MIITFCGHKDIFFRNDLEEKVSATIEEIAGGEAVTFYLGRDGSFDGIAIEACKKYRAEHPKSKMIFVTPYIFEEYMELRRWWLKEFDDIIYPELERTPYRYRIAKRNEWMVRAHQTEPASDANLKSRSLPVLLTYRL